MKLPCSNHGNSPWFSANRWAYLNGGEAAPDYNRVAYVSGSGGDDSSARAARLERRREAVAADAATTAAADAEAKSGTEVAAVVRPAKLGEAVDESGHIARERLRKREVDPKLEAGIAKFKPKIEAALDQEKLKDNFTELEKFAAFIKNHQVFEKGQGKQWNHDFCKDILGLDNLSAQEEHYAAFAYQRFMDNRLEEFGGYRLREKGITNSFTRMDGWIGAYGVNVLMFYVHEDCRGNTDRTVWNQWWQSRGAWSWVALGNSFDEDQKNDFERTKGRLEKIYGTRRQTDSTTQRTNTQGSGTNVARDDTSKADTSGAEKLNENFNTYLGHYSHLMHQRYPDLGLFPPRKDREQFIPLFNKVADYLDEEAEPSELTLDGWLRVFAKAGLTEEEHRILYSPPPSSIFEVPDLKSLRKIAVTAFYKGHHWTNYDGLKGDDAEVDDAWFTARNFLDKPEYSNQAVRNAFQTYEKAVHGHHRLHTSDSETRVNDALSALGTAIAEQEKAAEAYFKTWERPGCLPPGRYLHEEDFEDLRSKLALRLPYPFREVFRGEAHEVLKPIFKTLKEYGHDLSFENFFDLEAATHPDLFWKLHDQLLNEGFLDQAPNKTQENQEKLIKFYNNSIWIRNIDRFLSAYKKNFFPPEK